MKRIVNKHTFEVVYFAETADDLTTQPEAIDCTDGAHRWTSGTYRGYVPATSGDTTTCPRKHKKLIKVGNSYRVVRMGVSERNAKDNKERTGRWVGVRAKRNKLLDVSDKVLLRDFASPDLIDQDTDLKVVIEWRSKLRTLPKDYTCSTEAGVLATLDPTKVAIQDPKIKKIFIKLFSHGSTLD